MPSDIFNCLLTFLYWADTIQLSAHIGKTKKQCP